MNDPANSNEQPALRPALAQAQAAAVNSGADPDTGTEQYAYWASAVAVLVAICAVLVFETLPPRPVEQNSEQSLAVFKADQAINARDFRRARQLLDEHLAEDPNDAQAYHLRGLVRAVAGLYASALEDYAYAHGLDPTNPQHLQAQGEVKQTIGWHEQAIVDFTRVLTLDPHSTSALLRRSLSLGTLGFEGEAHADLDLIALIEPGNEAALLHRADLFSNFGRVEQAVEAYEQVVEQSSRYGEAASQKLEAIKHYQAQDRESKPKSSGAPFKKRN